MIAKEATTPATAFTVTDSVTASPTTVRVNVPGFRTVPTQERPSAETVGAKIVGSLDVHAGGLLNVVGAPLASTMLVRAPFTAAPSENVYVI